MKRCLVAFAHPRRQWLWPVELPDAASIADALAAARTLAGVDGAAVPWDAAPVGIFGQQRRREDAWADGDRIELYRPLERDPRDRRRERVARERRGGR
ncbi:MAG: RnfH family protein [Proteobacteria bacterium]|nr:RnfH family protein [Pseudomonadota bacterium]